MRLKELFTGILILICFPLFAATTDNNRKKEQITPSADSVQLSIDFLKKYLRATDVWQTENPAILHTVNGLIHFAEDEHIDSILVKLNLFQQNKDFRYIYRSPDQVKDSLKIKGFHSHQSILEKMRQLDRAIWNGVNMNSIPLPEELITGPNNKLEPINPGDEITILRKTHLVLPDSLKNVHAIPDSLVKSANDFNRIRKRQEVRTAMLERARQRYNNRISKLNLDSAITAYRHYAVRVFSDSLQNHLRDSLKIKNELVLKNYNDSVVRSINDSINRFVQTLQRYAQNDSVSVWIHSLTGKPARVWLRNNQRSINRFYIKNEQNDSLAIRMMNLDKHSLGIAIDDDVTFNRIAEKQRRDFKFEQLKPDQKLTKIQKKYNIITPWNIGGNGTFGFTQTYVENWKAGGKPAFSFLMVLRGYANYSDSKLKWENSGELRNGWIRQGGGINQTQKNDDKIELISRLGVSAFKKWYYSSEVDFVTQFFNGYNYPDKTKTISTYMSPAKTLIKIGLDYKPNKNFSLFLSPITAKLVFVRDTAKIDQTKFGVAANRRSFWEPGLNTDIRYKVNFAPTITYETKFKMFLNYQEPFKKIDINWENSVVAQLTDRINMSAMFYMLYDDNVTFPTGVKGADGKEIYKAKWQVKELVTVGFSYNLNKKVYRQKKAN
jgi:hypothetical protein